MPAVFFMPRAVRGVLIFKLCVYEETNMRFKLALVSEAHLEGCAIRWLDEDGVHPAGYSAPVLNRIKIRPRQLVAVDTSSAPPAIVWRWFRGVVVYREQDYVVVDNHRYQAGFRFPISVVRLPEALEVDVGLGAEVYYSLGIDGVVVDTVEAERPAHPERLATDLFPALEDACAEFEQEGA
jgi:hypothetical protein